MSQLHICTWCLRDMTDLCVLEVNAATNKMENRTEKLGGQQGEGRRSITYLAKIAVVLQDAPDQMLTFTQLMDKLTPPFCKDRKSFENNIRVCLSTHKCFVKIPMAPNSPESKRNYWKLDCSQITAKMVRRHFRGFLQLFPELASKVKVEKTSRPSEPHSAVRAPEAAARRAVGIRRVVQFRGPFSIESLLTRSSPSAQAYRASPLSSLQVGAKQQLQLTPSALLKASAACCHICSAGGSTHCGFSDGGGGGGAAVHVNRMHVCTEPSCLIYARAGAAAYFCCPYSSCITYSAPAFYP